VATPVPPLRSLARRPQPSTLNQQLLNHWDVSVAIVSHVKRVPFVVWVQHTDPDLLASASSSLAGYAKRQPKIERHESSRDIGSFICVGRQSVREVGLIRHLIVLQRGLGRFPVATRTFARAACSKPA
jgi:hypothetical protein